MFSILPTNYPFAQKPRRHHQSSYNIETLPCPVIKYFCIFQLAINWFKALHHSIFTPPPWFCIQEPLNNVPTPLYCASTHPKTPLMALLLPNPIPLHRQECQCKPSWWGNNALLSSPSSKLSWTSPCSAPPSPPQSPSLQSHHIR